MLTLLSLLHVISYKHYSIKRSIMGRYAGWLKVIIWLAQEPFKIRNLSANVGHRSVSTQSLSSNPAKNNNIIWPHLPLNLFSSFQPIWSYSEPVLLLRTCPSFLHLWTWRPNAQSPCFLQDLILHLVQAPDVLLVCWPERKVKLDVLIDSLALMFLRCFEPIAITDSLQRPSREITCLQSFIIDFNLNIETTKKNIRESLKLLNMVCVEHSLCQHCWYP